MPKHPFYWFVKEHGIHTFKNVQLGFNERDEGTHYPVLMHLWATHLPLLYEATQHKRGAATKNDRKRQRRLHQVRCEQCGRLQPVPSQLDSCNPHHTNCATSGSVSKPLCAVPCSPSHECNVRTLRRVIV